MRVYWYIPALAVNRNDFSYLLPDTRQWLLRYRPLGRIVTYSSAISPVMVLWLMSEMTGLAACLDSQEGFSASENYPSSKGRQRLKLAIRKKSFIICGLEWRMTAWERNKQKKVKLFANVTEYVKYIVRNIYCVEEVTLHWNFIVRKLNVWIDFKTEMWKEGIG